MTPPANRRRRCENTRTEGHALVAEQTILEQRQQQRRRSLRIRMEGGWICGKRKGMAKFGSFIGVMVAGLAGRWGTGANAQFTDGGAVAMDCGVCFCEGSSADGTIEVFDNPSSGERVRQLVCVVRSNRQSAVGRNELHGGFLRFCIGSAACRRILMSLVYFSPLTHTPPAKKFSDNGISCAFWRLMEMYSSRSSCQALRPHRSSCWLVSLFPTPAWKALPFDRATGTGDSRDDK